MFVHATERRRSSRSHLLQRSGVHDGWLLRAHVGSTRAVLFLAGASMFRELEPDGGLSPAAACRERRTDHLFYLGDIWVADVNGANPRRVTIHAAHDFEPRFSPDGQWIAFTSNRMGNNDVFVVPATGGEPKQLTWHTGNDAVQYWTPDGKGIVINSPRGARTRTFAAVRRANRWQRALRTSHGRGRHGNDQTGRIGARVQPRGADVLATRLQGQRHGQHLRREPDEQRDRSAHQP